MSATSPIPLKVDDFEEVEGEPDMRRARSDEHLDYLHKKQAWEMHNQKTQTDSFYDRNRSGASTWKAQSDSFVVPKATLHLQESAILRGLDLNPAPMYGISRVKIPTVVSQEHLSDFRMPHLLHYKYLKLQSKLTDVTLACMQYNQVEAANPQDLTFEKLSEQVTGFLLDLQLWYRVANIKNLARRDLPEGARNITDAALWAMDRLIDRADGLHNACSNARPDDLKFDELPEIKDDNAIFDDIADEVPTLDPTETLGYIIDASLHSIRLQIKGLKRLTRSLQEVTPQGEEEAVAVASLVAEVGGYFGSDTALNRYLINRHLSGRRVLEEARLALRLENQEQKKERVPNLDIGSDSELLDLELPLDNDFTATSTLQVLSSNGVSQSETLVEEEEMWPRTKDNLADDDEDLDTNSVSSHITTAREKDGKAHIAYFLATNPELRPIVRGVMNKVTREEFTKKGRMLLKDFYFGLLTEAETELQVQTVSLLKSQRGRIRISKDMAHTVLSADAEDAREKADAVEQRRMRMARLEGWASNYHHLAFDDEEIGMRKRRLDDQTAEHAHTPVGAEQHEENPWEQNGDDHDRDENHESCSEGEPRSERGDDQDMLPNIAEMEAFFRNSKAFQVLLDAFSKLLLPQSLKDILSSTSTELSTVEVSNEQNESFVNNVKAVVEGYTMLRWNWWPLEPYMRPLHPDERRLIWYCDCGTRLWKEISREEAELIRPILQMPCLKGSRQSGPPQCIVKTQGSFNLTKLLESITYIMFGTGRGRGKQHTSGNAPASTASVGTTTQTTGNAQPTGNPSNLPTSNSQPQGTHSAVQPQASSSTSSTPSTRFILFGVQGSRRSIELEHIEIDDYINDSHFYSSLRKHYRQHRGRLKLWFSIWRLGFCDGVKFDREAADLVLGNKIELPLNLVEYQYEPTPPTATNPLIDRHQALIFLNVNCDGRCRWPLFHECAPHIPSNKAVQRVPKKLSRFPVANVNALESEAWGLRVQHEVSAAYVAVYHALILIPPFVFWGWWQYTHLSDVQGAAVPATVVLAFLSLFWSASGILTEGRHSGR